LASSVEPAANRPGASLMLGRRRRSNESGHRPKFLVVIDDTEEFDRALYFAARRAMRTNSGVSLLAVVDPAGFNEWLGVGSVIQQEAEEAASSMLNRAAMRAREISGIQPDLVMKSGPRSEQILQLIEEDEDISFLVLAASSSVDGPGPLVSTLAAKSSGTFPVPIVIVPGAMTDEEIEALA
jgi:nucleotide-binding universal stress UspA family protein